MGKIEVRRAVIDDAMLIIEFVQRLLIELGGDLPIDKQSAINFCKRLLRTRNYYAFIANKDGLDVGMITVTECSALYVGGKLGWIQELYVTPEVRSQDIGKILITEAEKLAKGLGWLRLELDTPEVEAWPRTIAFYRRQGFIGASFHLKKKI